MRASRVLLLVFFLPGCGSSARTGSEPVYPVTGVVTYEGKPLVGADVTFFNADKDRSAFGRTDDEGRFQLTTFNSNDGAVEGKQIVTIAKAAPPSAPVEAPDVSSTSYVPPEVGQSATPAPPKSAFPEKYASQQTSGLVAMVQPNAENKIDFNLKN